LGYCFDPLRKNDSYAFNLVPIIFSRNTLIAFQILHSTGLEFQQELEEASDLDEVIAVHNRYVSRIFERCLLHKGVSLIKNVVTKVLNLCLHFHACWNAGCMGAIRSVTMQGAIFLNIVRIQLAPKFRFLGAAA
jgi:hypothetical protein